MRTIDLNLLVTLGLATTMYFVGLVCVQRSSLLQRFSIPVPVVGGVLVAVVLALVSLVARIQFTFDDSIKGPLLLAFFATLGLGADVRSLTRGGWKLVMLLLLFVALMVVQNTVGLTLARLLDLHPLIGLIGGSISLVGGHGTAAAYASSFSSSRNLQGVFELGMAAATLGLILGSVFAGPLAERLIQRNGKGRAGAAAEKPRAIAESPLSVPITAEQLLFVLLVCIVCIGVAHVVTDLMKGTGILLPDFLWALLVGMLVRNGATLVKAREINDSAVQAVGSVSLSLFLIMALMSMRILDLLTMAGPVLLIVVVNAIVTVAFAYFITSRLMGNDYDAAIISAGQVAAGLATTAVGMSVMQTLTERHGPAPLALMLVPIVGAFFADIANAIVLQVYFALPMLGF